LQPSDNGSNIATQSIHHVEFQLAFAFFLLALKTKYHAFMLTLISILPLSGKAEVEDHCLRPNACPTKQILPHLPFALKREMGAEGGVRDSSSM
jgi:hypothetical protein